MIKFFKAILNKISFAKASDEELVRSYQKTMNSKYFDLLYKRHNGKVYGKCLSMLNNTTTSKDALQEIFIKVLLNISNFNFKSKFSTWIYSITYNHCVDVIRKEGKLIFNQQELTEDFKEISSSENNEKMLLEMKVERLEQVLEKIPVKDKSILIMKYQGGMSIKEMSSIFNKSESAIKMSLKRAKEKGLRKYKELYN